MYFNEHNPPHFHAEYGEYRVVVNLNDEVVNGFMPGKTLLNFQDCFSIFVI